MAFKDSPGILLNGKGSGDQGGTDLLKELSVFSSMHSFPTHNPSLLSSFLSFQTDLLRHTFR